MLWCLCVPQQKARQKGKGMDPESAHVLAYMWAEISDSVNESGSKLKFHSGQLWQS